MLLKIFTLGFEPATERFNDAPFGAATPVP
jgi:hypothetical protein